MSIKHGVFLIQKIIDNYNTLHNSIGGIQNSTTCTVQVCTWQWIHTALLHVTLKFHSIFSKNQRKLSVWMV